MADDEGTRRYLQAGMAWFSVTQQKAEGILRDLTDSGETAVGQAQKMFERIVERGRQGSDELRDLVRSEIQEQVGALGLATKDDIARLEAKIDAAQAAPPAAPPATPPKAPGPKATTPKATGPKAAGPKGPRAGSKATGGPSPRSSPDDA